MNHQVVLVTLAYVPHGTGNKSKGHTKSHTKSCKHNLAMVELSIDTALAHIDSSIEPNTKNNNGSVNPRGIVDALLQGTGELPGRCAAGRCRSGAQEGGE